MSLFRTPDGEQVEARGAMARLFRRRGWIEGKPFEDGIVVTVPPSADARKAEWEAFATDRGVATEGLTKAQIIEAVQGLT